MNLTKTRVAELVRKSLRLGYFEAREDGAPAKQYYCPLNPYPRDELSHKITLAYHVIQPPKRADIERRFAEHFDPDSEECEYVAKAGNDPREADRRAARR